jgi:hypothetical protein
MKVWRSAQLYRKRNQASHAIPRPDAMLLAAIALLAYVSIVNKEPEAIEKTAVLTLEK